jgi:hypothetical protein
LAWTFEKVNAIMKRAGKGFLKLLTGKRWVHFSAKCVKSNAGSKGRKRVNYVN